MKQEETEDLYKIIVIGEASVGKSSLIMRYCDNDFNNNMISTAGVDFRKKTIKLDGKELKLIIFDTAGQARYRTISKHFYQGCRGVLLVYDVSEGSSFPNSKDWLKSISENADKDIEILFVGNKIDLPRVITTEEGKAFANENKILFFETSAKTGTGVEKSFEMLMKNILRKEVEKLQQEKANDNKGVNIEKEDPSKKKKASGCCSG